MKTIRQIASELAVSEQVTRLRIKSANISPMEKIGNVQLFAEDTAQRLYAIPRLKPGRTKRYNHLAIAKAIFQNDGSTSHMIPLDDIRKVLTVAQELCIPHDTFTLAECELIFAALRPVEQLPRLLALLKREIAQ